MPLGWILTIVPNPNEFSLLVGIWKPLESKDKKERLSVSSLSKIFNFTQKIETNEHF